MRRLLTVLAFATLLIGAPRAADAATTFDLTGTCTLACSNIGLNSGDAVSGSFTFNDAAIVPSGTVDATDLLSFVLDFGTVQISSATAIALFLNGTLNATATGLDPIPFMFVASEALQPATSDTIFLNDGGFGASATGNCNNTGCEIANFPGSAGGLFAITLRQVPEPGTLALLGAGLVGLAFARRRKRS